LRQTITSNVEINDLFQEARRSVHKNLIVLIADEKPERDYQGRVAFIAGKRLGNAPQRNRAKRLLREAAKLAGAPWEGLRVVLIAREELMSSSVESIRNSINNSLQQYHLL